uniref:Uncharacterized protein n=1 Tax=Arion vulgaris TaxID=1028688 RepID=A0A0B6Y9N8_9EUPU
MLVQHKTELMVTISDSSVFPKIKGTGVDTESDTCRFWSVVKYMAKVCSAFPTFHFHSLKTSKVLFL